MPLAPILRDVFEVRISGENQGGGFGPPARDAGKAIGRIANDSEIIWNGLRIDSELSQDTCFVAQHLATTIELHDASANYALTKVFVRRTNNHLSDALIYSGLGGRGSERIIRLELDHGPDQHAHRLQSFLENREL